MAMHQIINRETGKPPTPEEMQALRRRAGEILREWWYRSPEQIEWALTVAPDLGSEMPLLAPERGI